MRPRRTAIDLPIPLEPPVTSATLPCNTFSIIASSLYLAFCLLSTSSPVADLLPEPASHHDTVPSAPVPSLIPHSPFLLTKCGSTGYILQFFCATCKSLVLRVWLPCRQVPAPSCLSHMQFPTPQHYTPISRIIALQQMPATFHLPCHRDRKKDRTA